jgi:cyclophilin family peptidyl-prolyl cis-trans isomerase
MKWLVIALVACAMVLAACSDDNGDDAPGGESTSVQGYDPDQTPGGGSNVTPGASGQTPGAAATSAPQPSGDGGAVPTTGAKQYAQRPPMTIDVNKKYFATIKTEVGDMKFELYPQDAPETVNSFVFLSREGFYDGVTFHRVIPGFVAQGGDPTGTGRGGPGYNIPDEFNDRKFLDGTIGMAHTPAANSGGSQFYICFTPQPTLDGKYTVFGQLVEGRDVLDKLAPRNPDLGGDPGTMIETIEIEEE